MSLDKQRILSELGSVMNQLQSADCGCMGKLFSNQGGQQGGQGQCAMGSPLPTCGGCRRGWCQGHGYGQGMPNAGEPYQSNPSMNMNQHQPCMGRCNPHKLYADTYNYLNSNLMQPVVQEVYNDLKTITPANTVMNNPMGNQMGLGQGNAGNADMNMAQNKDPTGGNMNQMQNGMVAGNQMHHMPGMEAGSMGNQMQNMSGMGTANVNSMPMQQGQQPMNNMGGMGPEIAKMILGEGGPKNMPGQGGKLTSPMLIDAPQSPHGQVGVTPLNQTTGQINENMNQGQYAANMGSFGQNPTMQYMSQPGSAANAQNVPVQSNQNPGNAQMGMTNPAAQQMAAPNQRQYGQHTQGVMKFNEMFPGVMQGGDLGFDPMAIAIQMNPANQQKSAMDTMQKLMNGSPMNRVGNVNAQPGAPANVAQPQSVPVAQGQQLTNQQNLLSVQSQQVVPGQQQIDNTNAGVVPTQLAGVPQQQQQVYTAVTGANQQQIYQQSAVPQAQLNQNVIDPNTGAPVRGTGELNAQMQQPPAAPHSEAPAVQQMIKDPIFPADSSRNQPYHHYSKPQIRQDYNTLGQPVQMLPAQLFHPPEPSLPQTLSPQSETTKRYDPMKYSNVKSTVSKTSIMGNRPVGKSLSKSQLQHIYNQYKGSQSYTQQNLTPIQVPTHSDGRLNVTPQPNARQPLPVEKVGGDTIANNQNQITEKVDQVMGQVGDVPASINKPHGDMEAPKAAIIPERQAKLRNGLQDVVYTSYPTSAAWSFHGANDYRPISVGYRYRDLRR